MNFKYKIILILLCSFRTTCYHAQNFGYFGKKNFIDVKCTAYTPIVPEIIRKWDGGMSILRPNLYRPVILGLSINLGRLVANNKSVSLEFNTEFQSYYDPGFPKLRKLTEISVMPKFEFTNFQHVIPLGISHQFGIGYFQTNEKNTSNIPIQSQDYYRPLRGLNLMYAIVARKNITKFLLFNYGIRYTLNIPINYIIIQIDDTEYQSIGNLVTLELGLTYVF